MARSQSQSGGWAYSCDSDRKIEKYAGSSGGDSLHEQTFTDSPEGTREEAGLQFMLDHLSALKEAGSKEIIRRYLTNKAKCQLKCHPDGKAEASAALRKPLALLEGLDLEGLESTVQATQEQLREWQMSGGPQSPSQGEQKHPRRSERLRLKGERAKRTSVSGAHDATA